jgi:hypothetical protein
MQNKVQKEQLLRSQQLLSSIAEHVKQPLLYARQAAELAQHNAADFNPETVKSVANAGLLLVEHYLTWHHSSPGDINDEQLGLAALMHDTADRLRVIAKSQQVSLRLGITGKHFPVIADQKLLSSGFSALGLAFIEAANTGNSKEPEVIFGVHRSRWGLVAGVYSKDATIKADSFKRSLSLKGNARQLLPEASYSTMSGVAVADALFEKQAFRLRPSVHKGMTGLAVTLTPSPQLSLL